MQFTADGVVIDTLSPLLLTRADVSPVGVTMVALVELLQVDSQSRISVVTNANDANTYIGCELAQSASTANLEARKVSGGGLGLLAPALPTLLLESGQLYLLGFQNQGSASACIAIDGTMNTRATTSFESRSAAPSVGIRVEHARVRVRMAMLITKS